MFTMIKKISSTLQHPLLILIVGALITSYIAPIFTRAWQDHQKELELKTGLVSEISNAIASLLIKTQVTKVVTSTPYKEFYDAYADWESKSAIIESKLKAYFVNSPLPALWNNYSLILTDFAFLSISGDICENTKNAKNIQKFFGIDSKLMNETQTKNCPKEFDQLQQISLTPFRADLKAIDWNYLVQHGNETHLSHSWLTLKQNMISQKDRIIQEILNSQMQIS
jgi:hypothetical protein